MDAVGEVEPSPPASRARSDLRSVRPLSPSVHAVIYSHEDVADLVIGLGMPDVSKGARNGPIMFNGIFALIVNKMVGVGVFVTPPIILMLTGSAWVSFWLWVAGAVYSMIGSVSFHHQIIRTRRRLPCDMS